MGVVVAISGGDGNGVAIVEIPTVTNFAFGHTGEAQGPTITNLDESHVNVSGATATDEGTYTLTLSLKNKRTSFWSDMTTDDKTYTYTIGEAKVADPTITVNGSTVTGTDLGTYTYNGNEQGPDVTADERYVTVTNAKNIDAGDYTLTLSLVSKEFMTWSDGTTDDKVYTYKINKAAGSLDLSESSVALDKETTSVTVSATNYKGTLSISSNDETIATATTDGGSIVITSPNSKSGVTQIVATASGTNNYAEVTKTIEVNCTFVPVDTFANIVRNNQLTEVAEALKNGQITPDGLSWAVGDEAIVTMDGATYKWVIMGIDKDDSSTISGGSTGITFTDDSRIHYIIGMENCHLTKRAMNSSDTNSGSWDKSAMRTYCNGAFRTALPTDFQNAFKQFNVKTAESYNGSTVKTSQDYFALPAEMEVFGKRSYSNTVEASIPLKQFEWYKTSANRVKKLGDAGSATWWWERSPASDDSGDFCIVNTDGTANSYYASASYGVSPFGCI